MKPLTYVKFQSENDEGETVISKYCMCVQRNLSNLLLVEQDVNNLNCSFNNFKSVDLSLFKNLEYFSCTDSNLEELCDYFMLYKLKSIRIQRNKLKILPEKMPDCLEELCCQCNELEKLPLKMSNKLMSIDFSNNNVKVLPELPENLKELIGKNNILVRLSKRPQTLEVVNLHFNFLYVEYHIKTVEDYDFFYKISNIFNILFYLPKKKKTSRRIIDDDF
jgi:Leucine-rich repeat (LRR) protein